MKRWSALVVVTCIAFVGCSGDDGGSASDDSPGDDQTGDDDIGSDAMGSDGMGSDGPGATPNEPAGLEGTTNAHNAVRAMVDTTPALANLVWDDGLAATAAAWVAMCRDTDAPSGLIDHNPNRGSNVGENVYGSGGPATGVGAVQLWASEKANYNYATNGCNGVCGHYTQIVWRSTTKIGCAIGTCAGHTFGNVVVCNYSPAGNVGGQKPY